MKRNSVSSSLNRRARFMVAVEATAVAVAVASFEGGAKVDGQGAAMRSLAVR